MTVPPILTVTVNPTLDITTTTGRLKPQQKLRCDQPVYDPGGGGVNVSRVIKELGGESMAFVVLGGNVGEQIEEMLTARGIVHEVWPTSGETRFSLTVMEATTGLHYRFVLPGPVQPPDEAARLLARLSDLLVPGYRFVVASGSLPPGLPDDFYGRLAQLAQERGAKLVLDTHGPALRAALSYRPYLIRINHLEAQELIGGAADRAAHELARELIESRAVEVAIVTIGDQGTIVATPGQELEIRPPRVTVRSTVGAGDSFVGALTMGLAKGWTIEAASRYGVAAAAAAVTTEATELCEADQVNAYFTQMTQDAAVAAGSRSKAL